MPKSMILRLNMANKEIQYQDVPEDYAGFGGRGLIAKIMLSEVNPACSPLGPENKLIICPGLLTGTAAPCSGRISVGGKSPLTKTVKEANAGGVCAQMLAKLNLKAVVVENAPPKGEWFLLKIGREGAELLPAAEYKGLNNYELTERLRQKYGRHTGILSIGSAGERGYRNSSVQITDTLGRPSRAAARGGLGAVVGSKGLKAVILDVPGPAAPEYADKEKFSAAAKGYTQGIKNNPLSGQALPALGTAVLVNIVNAVGALPTRNYSSGQFAGAEQISGENLAKIQGGRQGKNGHACHPGCVIGCSNIYNTADGEYLTSGFEYETIGMLGSNCGISDLDTIARIDRLCDDVGIDTMETGASIAVCMEKGLLQFGDGEGALKLVQEMAAGTEIGRDLGQGTEYIGNKLGVKRIPTVKGQALAAYDPRSLKGTGVTYATSPMGADHTAGNSIGNPTLSPYQKEGQVELSTNLQVGMATFDNLGMCIFSGFCTDDPANVGHLLEMMAGKFGGEWEPNRLFGLGVKTLALEKEFNKGAGLTEKDNRLPDFMYSEPLSPQNTVFDIMAEELAMAVPF